MEQTYHTPVLVSANSILWTSYYEICMFSLNTTQANLLKIKAKAYFDTDKIDNTCIKVQADVSNNRVYVLGWPQKCYWYCCTCSCQGDSGVATGWYGWTMSRGPGAKGAPRETDKKKRKEREWRKEKRERNFSNTRTWPPPDISPWV